MKIIRAGNSELILSFFYYLISKGITIDLNSFDFYKNYFSTTSGYFNNNQIKSEENMRTFLMQYTQSLARAVLFVMKITDDKLREIREDEVENFYFQLEVGKLIIRQSINYNEISNDSLGKKVLLISPFSPLMKRQFDSGNMAKINPKFLPDSVLDYRFPYFHQNSNYESSIDVIQKLLADLNPLLSECNYVLLSCGPYGAILANYIAELGIDCVYTGGDLQIFFGILGSRWKVMMESRKDFIENKQYWIIETPVEYKPLNAKQIEGSCYWN